MSKILLILASAFSVNVYAQCVTPQVTALTPASGPIAGGLSFQINGTNFCSGVSVDFGAQQAQLTQVSQTLIAGTLPANPPGPVPVTITNPGVNAVTLQNQFMYIAAPSGLVASAGSAKFGSINQRLTFFGYVSGGVPPYSYYWNFKDGGTASVINGQHIYIAPGNYLVTFMVFDSLGSMASSETFAYVSRPIANFLLDNNEGFLLDDLGGRILAQ